MKLEQVLEEVGLAEREAKVYLAALELGEASVQDIAKKAGIERTGTYYLIESLIRDGIVGSVIKNKKTFYNAAEPERILDLTKRKAKVLEEHFSELKALYNISDKKPKVRLFEGIEGIKTVFEETLKLKSGKEFLAFSSFDIGHQFVDEWGHDYVSRRAKKGIFVRDIAEDSPEGRDHQARDKEELRQTRLVPRDRFPFTNEINILDNWILVISWKDMIALVVESKDVATMWRSVFELAWEGANQFSSNKLKSSNLNESLDKSNGYLIARVGQYGFIRNEEGRILALERARSKNWSLPGGRLNEDEKDQKKALYREIQEEAGLECEIGKIVDSTIIKNQDRVKACTYYEAFPKDLSSIVLSSEHTNLAWVGREEIEEYKFEYEEVKEIVRKFLEI